MIEETLVPARVAAPAASSRGWHRELTAEHWFVLLAASLGWLFDTMDQQLFTLARRPAVAELLHTVAGATPVSDGRIAEYAGYTTMIFMIGWASGGLVFGVLGDRVGRVKTMIITILFYSLFTGLSALSTGIWDFSAYRFLTGLENLAFGLHLSEYHTGLRAYSRGLLETIPYHLNSDDFVFDQELIAQVVAAGMRDRIGEIAVPTRYFEEASSVGFNRSVVYGLSTLRVVARYLLHRLHVRPSPKLTTRR